MDTKNNSKLRFFFNGIKVGKGQLQKASVSLTTGNELYISIYADGYAGFSEEIRKAFFVSNDSDVMTDYFCKDSINIYPDHKLFRDALVGCLKYSQRILSRYEKEDSRTYNKDLYIEKRKEEIAFIESLINDNEVLEIAIKERKKYVAKVAEKKRILDEKRAAQIKVDNEILLNSRNQQRAEKLLDNNYNIEKVIVHWSESNAFEDEKEYTFNEFLAAQDKALEIYGLHSGGYDKTKVTLKTGEHEYTTRLDISFNSDGDLIKDLNLTKNYIESGKCKEQCGYDDETSRTLVSLCNIFLTPKNQIKPTEKKYTSLCKEINEGLEKKEIFNKLFEIGNEIRTLLSDFDCKVKYKGSQSKDIIQLHKRVDNSEFIVGCEDEFDKYKDLIDHEFYYKMRKYGFSNAISLTISLRA